eukprot:CAMPEP_0202857442 /NCGR_PEP_ID=MMETSP1391-20130828/379_1 /ASSEMBLY_ACC=CAM_ASM_000867 /TAXON_ID=1034604 /ORGANISM="Chlamydomonas leiostraca, Strain SAG 11-49" /LENGTH=136 /DNA_ID=CAMNT_0049536239 /DNA_START=162 /DNA_END=572 /DNA_ORIENTATION=-
MSAKKAELASSGRKDEKARKKLEDASLKLSAQLFFYKMGTMVVNAVFLMATWKLVSAWYGGRPVARLPFHPPGFMTKASHAGLPGDDMTECSSNFIYVLSQMAIKGSVNKFLNAGATRALANHSQKPLLERLKKVD